MINSVYAQLEPKLPGLISFMVVAMGWGALVPMQIATNNSLVTYVARDTIPTTRQRDHDDEGVQAHGSWVRCQTGYTAYYEDLTFATTEIGAILGYKVTPTSSVRETVVVVTSDGARHWRRVANLPNEKVFPGVYEWTHVIMTNSRTIILAAGLTSSIYKSTNLGRSWKRCKILCPASNSIEWGFPDSRHGILAVNESIATHLFRTTNGGDTWMEVPLPEENMSRVLGFAFVSSSLGYIAYSELPLGSPSKEHGLITQFILSTSNTGASWRLDTAIQLERPGLSNHMFVDDGAVVMNSVAKKNNVARWFIDSTLLFQSYPVSELVHNRGYYIESGNILMVDINKHKPLSFCWQQDVKQGDAEYQLKADKPLSKIKFVSSDIGYVIGADGMVYKTLHRGEGWP
jgi:photosystem II stability/assembly factor-like uncharacterized protein